MKPVEEFLREKLLFGLLGAGSLISKITKKKHPKNLFWKNVEHKKIPTDVRVIKSTDDSSFIAKVNPDGTISNKEFKILLATDMHLGDTEEFRNKTFSMLYKHIEKVKPDLIIFTGDIILSRFQQFDSIQFARFMEEIGIYWAVVFGNHEAREEKEFHKYFMLKNMSRYPHCLSKFGPKELFGYGNFFINILNGENNILKSLVLFDSGRDVTEKYKKEYNLSDDFLGYDFIKENQIAWYENNIKKLKKDSPELKSLLFMHIPLMEFKEVMTLEEKEGEIPFGKPTGKGQILSGEMHESVGCPNYNSGLFNRALNLGAQGFFAGHDHMNDYWAIYKGAYLVYNQFSGYEEYSYGVQYNLPESQWNQGVLELKLLENGEIELKRHLNSEYL